MNQKKFDILHLPKEMLHNLEELGFSAMTPIQEQSLPIVMEGKDLIAQAKTGSGKTAAFGIPLLLKLDVKKFVPQAIVLCPTRELADQVAKELRRLARFKHNIKILTLSGGMPMRAQMQSLEHGAHVLVGTPGRILDHLSKHTLKLDKIKISVLDEADRMLDMGFYEDITKILSNTPTSRQNLLFSATFPDEIKQLASEFMHQPQSVKVASQHSAQTIAQNFFETDPAHKTEDLMKVLRFYQPNSVIIFANTKVEVTQLADDLIAAGFSALDLHGDLEQIDRTQTLLQFANRSCVILVATDVAARGLDIKDVDMVINYGLPREKANYIHRIGRTGRAGSEGKAVSLFTYKEKRKLDDIAKDVKIQLTENFNIDESIVLSAPMKTICIHGGKKNKLRAGDILGALGRDIGIDGKAIGKIDIFDFYAYVAVERGQFQKALKGLQEKKIKARKFRAWAL